MLIFDYDRYIKNIKKDGISATDVRATKKINDVMMNMIFNTSYKKGKIISLTKKLANDYYVGCDDDYINNALTRSYDEAKIKKYIFDNHESFFGNLETDVILKNTGITKKDFKNYKNEINEMLTLSEKKPITLYKSEMEKIIALPDEKLQRLAFSSLVAFKYYFYQRDIDERKYNPYVKDCIPDVYSLADFGGVSGTARNKLLKELVDSGMLYHGVITNSKYKYQSVDDSDHVRWLVFNVMSIPYCIEVIDIVKTIRGFNDEKLKKFVERIKIDEEQDTEEIYMQMTNFDNVQLYLRYYKGDPNVTLCKNCGTPIIKSGNAKKLCSDCVEMNKKASDKARYNLKTAI